jgi:hypothetical protein
MGRTITSKIAIQSLIDEGGGATGEVERWRYLILPPEVRVLPAV